MRRTTRHAPRHSPYQELALASRESDVHLLDSRRPASRASVPSVLSDWPGPPPLPDPPRPAAVLALRGIWLASHEATADLWLPPDADSPVGHRSPLGQGLR